MVRKRKRKDDAKPEEEPKLDEVDAALVKAMREVGSDEAFIHAYIKTGLIVSDLNAHLISKEDMAAWDAAVAEYRRTHKS